MLDKKATCIINALCLSVSPSNARIVSKRMDILSQFITKKKKISHRHCIGPLRHPVGAHPLLALWAGEG